MFVFHKMTEREAFLYGLRKEPLREGDMDFVGALFALKFTEGCGKYGCAELYIEDDEWYHYKTTFSRFWLKDLANVVKEALSKIEDREGK